MRINQKKHKKNENQPEKAQEKTSISTNFAGTVKDDPSVHINVRHHIAARRGNVFSQSDSHDGFYARKD